MQLKSKLPDVGTTIFSIMSRRAIEEGALNIDLNDEITRDSLVVRDGEIINARVQELLGVKAQSNS